MIAGKIWRAGNSYVVTIPREEMEARGLQVGQLVGIDPVPVEVRPVERLTPEQRAAGWQTQLEVERALEEHVARELASGRFTQAELTQAEHDIDREAEWLRQL